MPIENGMETDQYSDELKKAMAHYCQIVDFLVMPRASLMLLQLSREVDAGMRTCHSSDPKVLSTEVLSKILDTCGHPMFVEEIETWMSHLRFICEYPYEIVGDAPAFGGLLREQMSHEEFIAFCCWLESETKGAGIALYAGPLKL